MDALPIFGNRNRDCARKRLDCWLISSRTTFGQLSTVVDSPVTAVTALSLIDCLIWAIIEVPPEPFGGVGVGWLPTC